jgi:hypothetical protein
MNPLWKRLTSFGAVLSIVATLLNLYFILNIDEDTTTALPLVTMSLVCIAAYGFWLWSSLMLAKQFNLKRWPLWLMPIHPLFSILAYWLVNRRALLDDRPNP